MIVLVQHSKKHRDSLVRLLNNPNIEKWLLQVPFPYTYEDADFWLNKCKEDRKRKMDFSFAVENNGVHVGGIGLHKKFEHSAEVGYWTGEEYWGKGFAKEALKNIVNFGFRELNLKRIHAHVFEGNIPSEKLLLSSGFEYEGLLKKCHKKGETYFNSKLFAKVI